MLITVDLMDIIGFSVAIIIIIIVIILRKL